MSRQGFYYDQTKCVGCNACQMACKDAHNLEKGIVYRRVSTWETQEEDGSVLCLHYSGACNHCKHPTCMKYCPVHAIEKQEDGTVVQDVSKCIGCGTCTWVCPYGAPALSKMHGTAVKCDGCYGRRIQGHEPYCVEACITHCLQYGDLEDLSKGKQVTSDLPFLPEARNTDPSLAIHPRYKQTDCRSFAACEDTVREELKTINGEGKRCLILGGGIAAIHAAETVRKYSPNIEILILSKEQELPYSRPLLSKTYLKSLDASKILLKPGMWYEDHHILLKTGVVIKHLYPEEKVVELEDGSTCSYDLCIYALGAHAWVPPMEGYPMDGIYVVRQAEDLEGIHASLTLAKNVVVLGGGVIGLEMAEELRKMGAEVTVLEAAPRLMGRLLDEESSSVLKTKLEDTGIRVEEGVVVERVTADHDGCLQQVHLKDGRVIDADLMVVSCGIRANIDIAKEAGLVCERGVVVDRSMRTSIPAVYAAGDCISLAGRNPGLWDFSMETAEIAAVNAVRSLGKEEPVSYRAKASEVMMRTAGISIFAAGSLEERDDVQVTYDPLTKKQEHMMQEFAADARFSSAFLVNHRDGEAFAYRKYYWKSGQLVGAVLMGDLRELSEVKKRLEETE